MRCLQVTGELKSLPSSFSSWFFTAQCGEGPVVTSPLSFSSSSSSLCAVAITPFCSSKIAEGELKLKLFGKRNEAKGESNDGEKEEGKDSEEEEDNDVLITTKSVSVQLNQSSGTSGFFLKKSAGDAIETISTFTHKWITHQMHTDVLASLQCPHLMLAASVSFSNPALREELSLRILNPEGDCLATGKIQASGEMSLLMMISYEYKDKNLDLTVAGANAGVFTTPIVLGSPYVCCIDISDEEKEGHMFFNSSLLSYKLEGHLQKSAYSFGPICYIPRNSDGAQPRSTPNNFIFHAEIIRNGSSTTNSTVRMNAISCGVIDGPVISRKNLPLEWFKENEMEKFGYSGTYVLSSSSKESSISSIGTENYQKLDVCNLIYGESLKGQDDKLSVWLSVASVNCNDDKDGNSHFSSHAVCSCLLTEVERNSTCSGNESSIGEEPSGRSSADTILLRGCIDEISDIEGPFQKGDILELQCVISCLRSNSDCRRESNAQQEKRGSAELLLNSSSSAALEPSSALSQSQHSSTKSLLDELGKLLNKEMSTALDDNAEKKVINVIRDELKDKQKIIDRLINENTLKAQTITEQTQSAEALREEISKLKVTLAENRAALSYKEQEGEEAVRLAQEGVDSPISLHNCARNVLIQAVVECSRRLKQVDNERCELKKVIGDSVSVRKQYVSLSKAHKELQEAHLLQARHIQKLEKQYEKIKTYQNTIVMQEKVIAKMQSVVESYLREPAGRHPPRKQRDGEQPEVSRLKAEIASKDIRIESLQDQLVRSATESSREIADLRTRIFELEAGMELDDDEESDARSEASGQGFLLRDVLQSENDALKREVTARRSSSSSARSSRGKSPGEHLLAEDDHNKSFVDLSGTLHSSSRAKPISLENFYRPTSKGSPRPVSPSEKSDLSSPARTGGSRRSSDETHLRRNGSRNTSIAEPEPEPHSRLTSGKVSKTSLFSDDKLLLDGLLGGRPPHSAGIDKHDNISSESRGTLLEF